MRDTSDDAARVEAFLGARRAKPTVTPIATPELAALWPSSTFWAVTFPMWPVGQDPGPGLASQNLVVVGEDGEVTALTRQEQIDDLFDLRFRGGETPADARTAEQAARAYLALSEALIMDGYYAFETVEASGREGEGKARALVTAGGNGELRVTVRIDMRFRAEYVNAARMGPRPRCHATKLLHPDPIVRRIAHDDLIFMGRAARGYLLEQRAKAPPALRRAIDDLLREIDGAE